MGHAEEEESKTEQIDPEEEEKKLQAEEELLMSQEERFFFSPANGNVIFGSALDCWAFTLTDFARLYAKKMGFNPKVLRKYLWGNYYFSQK